jgi:hypothetical protein
MLCTLQHAQYDAARAPDATATAMGLPGLAATLRSCGRSAGSHQCRRAVSCQEAINLWLRFCDLGGQCR